MKPALTVVTRYLMLLCCAMVLFSKGAHAADELNRTAIDAITVEGDKVRLYPNGRWEYVDAARSCQATRITTVAQWAARGTEAGADWFRVFRPEADRRDFVSFGRTLNTVELSSELAGRE
jgi:hypothetical protein